MRQDQEMRIKTNRIARQWQLALAKRPQVVQGIRLHFNHFPSSIKKP